MHSISFLVYVVQDSDAGLFCTCSVFQYFAGGMQKLTLLVCAALAAASCVEAWGGIFNRYSQHTTTGRIDVTM